MTSTIKTLICLVLVVLPFAAVSAKKQNIVNEHEYQVCMLVRAGFTPSDICTLTGTSKSYIANVRKRLFTKLTGRDGSSKDFDAYINSL